MSIFERYLFTSELQQMFVLHYTGVPGFMFTTSRFNSRADSELKSHIHMGPIRNGSGVMSF